MLHHHLEKLNGVLAVYKPKGVTSAQFLDKIKFKIINAAFGPDTRPSSKGKHKKTNKLLKMGHGGTLDPMAEGVLVIGLGSGCKRMADFLSGSKEYQFELLLGDHYDTFDCTGKLLESKPFDHVTPDTVTRQIIPRFTGEIMQRPPLYSAIRVNGKRAHSLAREQSENGEILDELPARPVTVHSLTLDAFDLPRLQMTAAVGGGCYIRSLCVDMANSMGTVGTMSKLLRSKQGSFSLNDCVRMFDDGEQVDLDLLKSLLK